jgi:hypothetical protein
MISPCGHDRCVHKGHHSCLPTFRPGGSGLTLTIERKVGHPAKIRAAEPRKQKHDRPDAALLLKLQVENRFPSIWMPSTERDLRTFLLHRHQWVRMWTRVQNAITQTNGMTLPKID